ncbi:hypothetical protein D3OALGA1CA_4094 [Olavius algarvensis associated proteobacterium Delta 3]|nr:hypothetical protein D3OALGB2SA_1008 [Olavius algarvensis associated proteobacterium Delta 3]CAB5145111.1 hypothetical protein D3OALGA1CA_4094 [Olavius algarvensis associated proteobacterium Delta 3]
MRPYSIDDSHCRNPPLRDSGKHTVPLRPLRRCGHRFHMSANGTYIGQPL